MVLTNLGEYSEMTYTPARGSNSVGQSSVLIKRRSRVQVPPIPPLGRGPIGKDAGLLPRRLVVRLHPSQRRNLYPQLQ